MNAIALCHNRDLQKTNGRIIVLGSGSISLMQTATWVNMQPYSQSKWFVLHLDYVMVCLPVCLSAVCVYPSVCWLVGLWPYFLHSCLSIHTSTHLSLPSCHAQINLFTRPTRSPKWLNRFSFFVSEASSQTSSLFLYSTCLPEMGALLCSLLTVKSWENCPEILSKKECK